jgi:hypothetical protein
MQMTIFLDIEEANFLRLIIPDASGASEAITQALRNREYWGAEGRDVIIECDDIEGNELYAYAQSYCPSAIEKIRRAFRLAHLPLESSTGEQQRYR